MSGAPGQVAADELAFTRADGERGVLVESCLEVCVSWARPKSSGGSSARALVAIYKTGLGEGRGRMPQRLDSRSLGVSR
jgi:hypothetical protein